MAGWRAGTKRFERLMHCIDGGHERQMALKANPDIARAEIIEIVKLRSWAAEKQWQLDRGGDCVELRARLHARHEQHVDGRLLHRPSIARWCRPLRSSPWRWYGP